MLLVRYLRFAICLLCLLPGGVLRVHPAYAQEVTTAAQEGAVLSFSETMHQFGDVPTDTTIEHRFEYTNSGNALLIINDITLSCPCFTADWSRGPVMPGGKGWVSVQYPTTDKPGAFDKVLWIASNAANNDAATGRIELRVRGTVVDRKEAAGNGLGEKSRSRKRRR